VLLVLAVAAAGVAWYLLYRPVNDAPAGKPVTVTVKKGTSTAQIAEMLADKGVVASPLMFRLKVRDSAAAGSLKAGTYTLATGMPYDLVIEHLHKGPEIIYVDVPIPEGWTSLQIAERLEARVGIPRDEFLALAGNGAPEFAEEFPFVKGAYGDSLEGFLFPATYRFREGATAKQAITMMLQAFADRTHDLDMSYAKSKNLTLTDVVTIASIIEKEVRLADEYPLVASVLYNRLKADMRLQLDSTVFFGLPPGTKILTEADLHNDHPYNTYSHPGLPPGPMNNPGLAAIKAAAKPKKTTYLYYVLTSKDGSQTFTSTYAEHLKAVEKYRKLIGK
jgi:UPF0755 protein